MAPGEVWSVDLREKRVNMWCYEARFFLFCIFVCSGGNPLLRREGEIEVLTLGSDGGRGIGERGGLDKSGIRSKGQESRGISWVDGFFCFSIRGELASSLERRW